MPNSNTRHVTGLGRFVDDLAPSDAAVMVVLRAPVAHGIIEVLDVSTARQMPGVVDVLTNADLHREGVGPLNSNASVTGSDGRAMLQPDRPVLAHGKVVYLGQPVAAVVAENMSAALDAIEAIALDIHDLPAVLDPVQAQTAQPIWPDIPGNLSFEWDKGNAAEMKAAFAEADHVVALDIVHPRMSVAPMETRGCVASFTGGRFELITGSQGVVSIRRALAKTLGVAEDELVVKTPDVGGSFAVKIWAYPEHVLALIAARRLGRPV